MRTSHLSTWDIYNQLISEGSWAAMGRKMCLLAARYYSGVDSVDELKDYADPEWGLLTREQVQSIIDDR